MFRFIQYSLLALIVNGFAGMYTDRWTGTTKIVLFGQQPGIATELIIQPKSKFQPPEIIMPLDVNIFDTLFSFPQKNKDEKGNHTYARLPEDPSPVPVFGVYLM